ncbi:hypothetical protein CYL18_15325 [Pradoshia eiseniae]|uniref:HTH tetR-type domain-containing protein n=1 Tax=Pradoshia eiseniae TaxID=2064768 RepID=A0A2S7MWX5_9BACI|nr:hypothetical protein CYL18_15325 [Pradoshia eiseniae]
MKLCQFLELENLKFKKALFDACVELVQEKDFKHITINEVLGRADLNRGIFYLHFADKYDMMDSFENEMIEKIEAWAREYTLADSAKEHFIFMNFHK